MKKETESKELINRSIELLLRYQCFEVDILAGFVLLTKVLLPATVHMKRIWYYHLVVLAQSVFLLNLVTNYPIMRADSSVEL